MFFLYIEISKPVVLQHLEAMTAVFTQNTNSKKSKFIKETAVLMQIDSVKVLLLRRTGV